MPETQRQAIGRYGAHKSWGQTVDRSVRTSRARAASPSSVEYHLARLDPDRFADARTIRQPAPVTQTDHYHGSASPVMIVTCEAWAPCGTWS